MKYLVISIGLLLAAAGVFFIPVSFSVDGFGLVVNPGGVRTVRAAEAGTVLHFAPHEGRFHPGRIVTAVTRPDTEARNRALLGTLQKTLAKSDTDYLVEMSKRQAELERAEAKRAATAERLEARGELAANRAELLAALRRFSERSEDDIDALNEERLSQLARLEDLLRRSGEVAAIPSQQLAKMLGEIQTGRLSVITSESARFNSGKMILDMQKVLNDLTYSNAIDEAEIDILSEQIADLKVQIRELDRLRGSSRVEAEASFLARLVWPELAIAGGEAVDIRSLQSNRATVSRNDALRLIEERRPALGLSVLIRGQPQTGRALINTGSRDVEIALPMQPDALARALRDGGLDVAAVHHDAAIVGGVRITSIFAELATPPAEPPAILSTEARDGDGVPISVIAEIAGFETAGGAEPDNGETEIIGFLENRYAVVLEPGQNVRGAVNDTKGTAAEIHFQARLLDRDYSTVDTGELGIRLGNQSLASKIIKRGVLSQVVIGVDASSGALLQSLPGAVVQLSFPLARQSLFSFLVARNVAL